MIDARFGTLRRISGHRHQVADIAGYQATHPDPQDKDGNAIESNPYGLAAVGATVRGHRCRQQRRAAGQRRRPDPDPATIPLHMVSTCHLPDFPAPMLPAEAVPTSVAIGPDGAYYVGELTGFPFTPGASRIWRVDRGRAARSATPTPATAARSSRTASRPSPAWTSVGTAACTSSRWAKAGVRRNLQRRRSPRARWIRAQGRHSNRAHSPGQLTAPGDVAVARNGTVYVTNLSISPDAGQVIAVTP